MKAMTSFPTMQGRFIRHLVVAIFASTIACCSVAQQTAGWTGTKITKTDLLQGETKHGKFAYFQAAVTTRAGCHVAKVEGERGKEVFVRRDGRRGKAYEDIAHPVFSPDGNALAYAIRGAGGSRFIVNEREGPSFEEVIPDTFVFSNDGKRHAYLARKAGRLLAVVDGDSQTEAGGDMVPWIQPPVFSADGSSVGYLEGSRLRKKMRVVVNGRHGEIFDGVDLQSLHYLTHSGGTRRVYVDGKADDIEMDSLVGGMVFSDDSKRLAYGGRRGNKFFLVVDGKQGADYDALGYFGFSLDGKHIAFAAKNGDKLVVVVDGQQREEFSAVPAGPVFRSDGVLEFLAADQTSLYRIEVTGL